MLQKMIIAFRDARDWRQFHNPKDLSISISLEAAELLEHFQWKNDAEIKEYLAKHSQEIGYEMADILNYLLLLAHELGIDLVQVTEEKLKITDKKYPAEKATGSHKKYTELW